MRNRNGVDCQVVLSGNTGVASSPKGEYLSISFLWAVGTYLLCHCHDSWCIDEFLTGASLGVWCSAGVSGGHNNPVITLMLAIFRGFPWKKVPIYIISQLLGAIVGAAVTYANYFHAIDLYEGGSGIRTVPGTASLFGTYAVRKIYMCYSNIYLMEFSRPIIWPMVCFCYFFERLLN